MGFSGGGSNITKPHTHDSTVIQDGGSLAANVTQFGLSAGSILYSDGSNIQELTVGLASNALIVNPTATAPEWGSPAANVQTVSTLLAANFSTTSATAVQMGAGTFRLTLPNIPGGKCLVVCSGTWERSTSGGAWGQLYTDATGSDAQIYGTARASEFEVDVVVPRYCFSSNCIHDADGSDISCYVLTGGGTLLCSGSGSSGNSWCMSAIAVA